MARQNELLICSTRNVSVAVPSEWYPDQAVVVAMAYVSQEVLNTLHLNLGRARIRFVVDASPGADHILLRTSDTIWNTEAKILVHPRMKHMVVSSRSIDEIAGLVASGAAVSRHIIFHPFTNESAIDAVSKRASSLALEFIANARARQNA